MPIKYEAVAIYSFWAMARTKFLRWRSYLQGWYLQCWKSKSQNNLTGFMQDWSALKIWNSCHVQFPSTGPDQIWTYRFKSQGSYFQVQSSNGQNDSPVTNSHVKLICPKNMKQLSFTVSKQRARNDFQGNSHYVKVNGQNIEITAAHSSHCRLKCPENMEQLPCSLRAMGQTIFPRWSSYFQG